MVFRHYYSTNTARWQKFDAARHSRKQANQNTPSLHLCNADAMPLQRANIAFQILSPNGHLHIHHDVSHGVNALPISLYWHFPEKAE